VRFNPLYLENATQMIPEDQQDLEVTSFWIEPVTLNVIMSAWVPNTSRKRVLFGLGSANSAEVHFVDPTQFGATAIAPLRRPNAISCTAIGDCWVVGQGGLIVVREWVRQSNPPMFRYANESTKSGGFMPPNVNLNAVRLLPMAMDPSMYDIAGVGDSGVFFRGTRQEFVFMGMPMIIRSVAQPAYSSLFGGRSLRTLVLQQGSSDVQIVGGEGGFIAQVWAGFDQKMPAQPQVQPFDIGARDTIVDQLHLGSRALVLTSNGQYFDGPLPPVPSLP
jgi:hypothetical protein